MSDTNPNRQPKGIPTGGQFATSEKAEADIDLGEHVAERKQFFPAAPLTPRDVEHLVANKGRFENGYDSDDINSVLGEFESARLVCVWRQYDDYGYGGDSEFAGMARVDGREAGAWRTVHPDVWEFLSDPECDIDPERIPSLVVDEVFEGPGIDDLHDDGYANLAVDGCSFDVDTADDYDIERHALVHPNCPRGS